MTDSDLMISYKAGKPHVGVYFGQPLRFSKASIGKGRSCWIAETNSGIQVVHDALNTIAVFDVGNDDPTLYTCRTKKTSFSACGLMTAPKARIGF